MWQWSRPGPPRRWRQIGNLGQHVVIVANKKKQARQQASTDKVKERRSEHWAHSIPSLHPPSLLSLSPSPPPRTPPPPLFLLPGRQAAPHRLVDRPWRGPGRQKPNGGSGGRGVANYLNKSINVFAVPTYYKVSQSCGHRFLQSFGSITRCGVWLRVLACVCVCVCECVCIGVCLGLWVRGKVYTIMSILFSFHSTYYILFWCCFIFLSSQTSEARLSNSNFLPRLAELSIWGLRFCSVIPRVASRPISL